NDQDRSTPIRIVFGDCTSSPVPFVSGPRPLPLQAEAGELTARDDANTGLRGGDDGSGGGSGQRNRVPTTSFRLPVATGGLDKLTIRRAIKPNLQKIQYCYERQLLSRPTLAGRVVVQFYILPSGKVASTAASGIDPEVASCVADVIK